MKQNQGQSSFLPDFCGVRMLFVVILIAELLAIVITLALPNYVTGRAPDLALNSLFIQWVALSSISALCVSRAYLNSLPDHWAATLSYLLVLIVSLIITEIAWWLLYEWPDTGNYTSQPHTAFLFRCMGISAIVHALALRYFYIQHQWRRNIESETQSRIQALQSRIRPHFFFNCMNTIASLTRKQPKLAEQAVEDLAELFRDSLKDAKQLSTLAEEFELCKRYLRIESYRLGDRLQTHWDIDLLPKDTQIPSLTLQPLLENAIYHGIETLPEGGTVSISGKRVGNEVIININNPLPTQKNTDNRTGNRFAQDNIRQRIAAYFGTKSKLNIVINNDHYHVQITLPYRNEDISR